jgi:CheY-like chemotaxis protein
MTVETELSSILYVEDDLHIRTTAKLVLEVIGQYAVRECRSGHEALVAAQDFQPDLILLDMMMPELDGLATLALLRGMPHLANTPAMFITDQATPDDIARYMAAGAIGVIPKPLVPLRLAGQVHAMWRQRLLAA